MGAEIWASRSRCGIQLLGTAWGQLPPVAALAPVAMVILKWDQASLISPPVDRWQGSQRVEGEEPAALPSGRN